MRCLYRFAIGAWAGQTPLQTGYVLVQVAFFQLIALPMYITFQLAFPACRPMVETLMANYQDWVDQENSYKQQQTPAQTKT